MVVTIMANTMDLQPWAKKIGTSKSTAIDAAYVAEHRPLKYLRKKIAHYLHDYRRHWFPRFGLPPPNGEHDQLRLYNLFFSS